MKVGQGRSFRKKSCGVFRDMFIENDIRLDAHVGSGNRRSGFLRVNSSRQICRAVVWIGRPRAYRHTVQVGASRSGGNTTCWVLDVLSRLTFTRSMLRAQFGSGDLGGQVECARPRPISRSAVVDQQGAVGVDVDGAPAVEEGGGERDARI